MPGLNKTERFMRELNTVKEIQRVAAYHGTHMTEEQAHEAWAEHSEDFCAGWLAFDSENARAEIRQAIIKYRARHATKLRKVQRRIRRYLKKQWEKEYDEMAQANRPLLPKII